MAKVFDLLFFEPYVNLLNAILWHKVFNLLLFAPNVKTLHAAAITWGPKHKIAPDPYYEGRGSHISKDKYSVNSPYNPNSFGVSPLIVSGGGKLPWLCFDLLY